MASPPPVFGVNESQNAIDERIDEQREHEQQRRQQPAASRRRSRGGEPVRSEGLRRRCAVIGAPCLRRRRARLAGSKARRTFLADAGRTRRAEPQLGPSAGRARTMKARPWYSALATVAGARAACCARRRQSSGRACDRTLSPDPHRRARQAFERRAADLDRRPPRPPAHSARLRGGCGSP